MANNSIYGDIAVRTGGDIYIGVVGPVRSGKSTFIQKFLDALVIPNIENEYDRARTEAETPQSASGKTIMTTEPKFVPDESVKIKVDGTTELNVKLIDCVGYMVSGALGAMENGEERMVKTPWSDSEMPFEEAAELGTSKVISEHSTIAVLVTTDGTISDIPRESYIEAEERVARELNERAKPFAIVLNSRYPESDAARELALSLEEKYKTSVALINCTTMNSEDVGEILSLVLAEFPVKELNFALPEWCEVLPKDHRIQKEALERVSAFAAGVRKFSDIERCLKSSPDIIKTSLSAKDGIGEFTLPVDKSEYYKSLSEFCSLEINDDKELFSTVCHLAKCEKEYSKVASALLDVKEKGYGIVMPEPDEMELDEPELTKQSGGYGVKLSARANSIHMIKTELKTELCPIVGTAEQTEEVVKYLIGEYENDKDKIWESNMFGKSIYDLVKDGMNAKLYNIPDDSREKLGETLERVVNEGANGLICILL